MHFWIDKPTGRYYGFSGRRYPAATLPKAHSGQHRRSGELRPMVTPVHRFQSLGLAAGNTTAAAGAAAGPSHANASRATRQQSAQRHATEHRNGSSEIPQQGQTLNRILNNVTNPGSNHQVVPTVTPNVANRGLLDFSEFSDAELASYRLRCVVWITFVLATGFVAAAKFYFDHQGTGLEVLIFCGLLVTLLLSGCFYSILCRRAQSHHRRELQAQDDRAVALTSANANVVNETTVTTAPAVVRQNPPPPYHIAILIPPPHQADEAPPPSYDKVMR